MSEQSPFVKPEIIVVEPTGQQKRYMLKIHGDTETIKKKWRSHLRNIGARWVDKYSHWTIAKENLKDFERIKKLLESDKPVVFEEKKNNKEKKNNDTKKQKKQQSPSSSSSSETSDSSESSDDEDSDVELIEYIKNKIKTNRSNHPEIDDTSISESDHEDVVSISRRLRFLYKMMSSFKSEIKNLQEENAFLFREINKLTQK